MSSIFPSESPEVAFIPALVCSICGGCGAAGEEGKLGRVLSTLGRLHHLRIVHFRCVLLCARSYAFPQSRLNETHPGILRLSEREVLSTGEAFRAHPRFLSNDHDCERVHH